MTFSSHPLLKFLLAIATGIGVGIWQDSWGWGIGIFAGLMFIFIWVASWIFGSPFDKGKVPLTEGLGTLLGELAEIGSIKNNLPLDSRGLCNRLGLYVQLKDFGDRSRLQSGDKRHVFIDAWQEHGSDWKVHKYHRGEWERLVRPALIVAKAVRAESAITASFVQSLDSAIQDFHRTGKLHLESGEPVTRSCVFCKYGPDVIACQMGKTGKPRLRTDIEMNPFGPQPPSYYYLTQRDNMPCFEPSDE